MRAFSRALAVTVAAVFAIGALGSVPAGLGVVEGDEIPYKPEALKKKKENQENWLKRDPEIKCYLPGVPRATYMPYPVPDRPERHSVLHRYEYAGAVRNIYLKDPGRRRSIRGWGSRSAVGRRHARRRRHRLQRSDAGSIAPATTTATR